MRGLNVSEPLLDRPDAAELLRRASNALISQRTPRVRFLPFANGKQRRSFHLHHVAAGLFACGNVEHNGKAFVAHVASGR